MPRGLVLLISAVALPGLGVAEYLFFFGDVLVRLHLPDKVADLLIGSQWAAVLMGACWVLRALASLVDWAVTSRRTSGEAGASGGHQSRPDLITARSAERDGRARGHRPSPADGQTTGTMPTPAAHMRRHGGSAGG